MERSSLYFLIGFTIGLIVFVVLKIINNRIIRRTQIGDCFEAIHNKRKDTYSVCQRLTEKTEENFIKRKSEINKQTLKSKLSYMGKIFVRDLNGIFDKLDYNKTYTIKTHDAIANKILKFERDGEIIILKNKKKSTRILFETISFLGLIDFLNILFIQELRKEHLWKTFYEIEFMKIEKAKEPKEIEEPKEPENPEKDKQPEK